ncbi:MAG TPA: hypothetical protein DDW50_01575 [Firmicutes bacterium]|jgi:peptidoglycan hydrolase-like protein with peptidoglycan-binding domain|nr:hypothetical protein [Bacillota bacterium]
MSGFAGLTPKENSRESEFQKNENGWNPFWKGSRPGLGGGISPEDIFLMMRDDLARQSPGWKKDPQAALVQASLTGAGFDIGPHGIDGIIGTDTKGAIEKFQAAMRLKPTGELDARTREALELVTKDGLNAQKIRMMKGNQAAGEQIEGTRPKIKEKKPAKNDINAYRKKQMESKSNYTHAEGTPYQVTYSNDITIEIRTGGSWSWRNNNPGNIEAGSFANKNGSIGQAGRFAVFPDYATGFNAIINNLSTPSYQNLTVYQAIERWAPPVENNSKAYANFISKTTSLSLNTPMNSLTKEQLHSVANAISIYEGYKVGKIEIRDRK